MNRETERFLRCALEIGALEIIPEGRKLKSGRMSPYFFNSGLFTTGLTLHTLLQAYHTAWSKHPFLGHQMDQVEVVYGPAYKGIPLATGLALLNPSLWHLGYAFDRKEAKDHGEGGVVVGASMEGKRVMIIDDVMTSGISSVEAVEIVKAHGGIPVGALIAFDRQEVGQDGKLSAVQEFDWKFQIPVAAAATLENLLVLLRSDGHSIVPAIEAYRDQYGVLSGRDDEEPEVPVGIRKGIEAARRFAEDSAPLRPITSLRRPSDPPLRG